MRDHVVVLMRDVWKQVVAEMVRLKLEVGLFQVLTSLEMGVALALRVGFCVSWSVIVVA